MKGLADASRLLPGHGDLRALLYAQGSVAAAEVGAKVEYMHRVSERVSVFGTGWGAAKHTGTWRPDFGVGAGLRVDW